MNSIPPTPAEWAQSAESSVCRDGIATSVVAGDGLGRAKKI